MEGRGKSESLVKIEINVNVNTADAKTLRSGVTQPVLDKKL